MDKEIQPSFQEKDIDCGYIGHKCWGRAGEICVSNEQKITGRQIRLRDEELHLMSSGS